MRKDFFVDSTYIKINESPRSDILPSFYGIEVLDMNLAVNIKTTIQNFHRIRSRLGTLDVLTNKVLIEYDGNFLLNFPLVLKFLNRDIYIDCHNCAVETEAGKALRYRLNLIYLYCLKAIFRAQIIVHNQAIMDSYPISSLVVNTPYPDLDRYKSKVKDNDVLFCCSLNSDEPIESIITTCEELEERGYKAKITGDFTKLGQEIQAKGARFFSGYLSKASYFGLLARSQIMVCLTNREKTLLYGPREGISLGLKVVMNSSQVNKDFYGDRAIYVNSQGRLADVVINAIE